MRTALRAAKGALFMVYVSIAIARMALGTVMLGTALWLVWPDGSSTLWNGLAFLTGWWGCAIMLTGIEQFAEAVSKNLPPTNPHAAPMLPRRPDEREATGRNVARIRR
ncbi:hypothetical protein [Bradyrhizobium iriomotense]|uniref:Uncharacterized protein n=1 Tax=Bradyrhizobium iriomotense TaxID=441950 RepID=A0ABQ6BAU7_9BRAD|nr:hypothetical protein [Bradyrhizobium iriomotense]GLR89766.1 hypothetical protein GCM10007857_64800 [Bradyrhizobium iriomotense]